MNVADADVARYLKILTLLPLEAIEGIIGRHEAQPEARIGQSELAKEVVRIIFGQKAWDQAEMIT